MNNRQKLRNRVKLKRLFGYGVGDLGLNIYWQAVSMFLVYWYIEIIGLDPRIAGLLFFVGMAWDAISDPIVASFAERLNSKMGTYRPFLLFGSPVTALSFILLFYPPALEGGHEIAFLLCTALIFRTSYTIIAIPYAAMGSRITYDSRQRADYSGARMFFAFLALLLVSMWLWPSIEYFSQSTGSEERAFQITAAIGAMVATLAVLLCFLMTREKPLPPDSVQTKNIWSGIWMSIRHNRALRYFIPIIFLNTAAGSTLGITLIFYIEANAERFATKEVLFTSFAVSMLVMVPIWTNAIKLWGRKKVWTFASLSYLCVALHLLFGPDIIVFGIPVHILLFMSLGSAHSIIFWALVPDCVEFGQYESGVRSEAGTYGIVAISQKMTGGLSGLIVGFMLASFGLTDVLAPSEILADQLKVFIAIIPTLMILISIIPILLLKMDRGTHNKIIGTLNLSLADGEGKG